MRSLKPIISNSSPHIIVANEGITLPSLSKEDEMILRSNKRLQNQKRTGRQGYGWVAVDVKASPEQIFTALEDFKG